jgi:hypothetical protein
MSLQTCLKYKYPQYLVRISRHSYEQIKQKQSRENFRISVSYDRRKRLISSYNSLAHEWLSEEYAIINKF